MISEIKIGNFKAFGPTQTIPLRPLTLVFGPNSAGKSSIIQSLLLAREISDLDKADVHQTYLGGSSVDLGGFHQYAHKHRAIPEPLFELTFRRSELGEGESGEKLHLMGSFTAFGFIFTIGQRPLDGVVITSVTLCVDGADLLRLDRIEDGEFRMESTSEEASRRLSHLACESHSLLPTPTRLIQELARARFKLRGLELEIVNPLKTVVWDYQLGDQTDPFHYYLNELREEWQETHQGEGRKKIQQGVYRRNWGDETFAILEPDYADEAKAMAVRHDVECLIRAANRLVKKAVGSVSYLGPLRDIPPRYSMESDENDVSRTAYGGDAWLRLKRDTTLLANVNRVLHEVLHLRFTLDTVPFARLEDRALEYIVHCALEEAKRGGERSSAEIAEEIRTELRSAAAIETRMTELRVLVSETGSESPVEVSLRDVGTGISQLLPVIVNSLALQQHVIAIEQPELHLHPALQAELGDVFIESALGENKNTFLIETHSEHLILRLLKRIRQTTGGMNSGLPPVRPEDVAILFVQPTENGSVVLHLRVDQHGRLLDDWPGGFFEESFNEMF